MDCDKCRAVICCSLCALLPLDVMLSAGFTAQYITDKRSKISAVDTLRV